MIIGHAIQNIPIKLDTGEAHQKDGSYSYPMLCHLKHRYPEMQ